MDLSICESSYEANPADIFTLLTNHTYQSYLIEEEMADKEAKSTTRKTMTNDQANYYSGIVSIKVNGKNAYELKRKLFDDLHKNAFSGALWDYWKLGSDEIEPTNEEPFDLEETDHDDEQEIGEIFKIETNLFDYETPLCEEFKIFTNGTKICHGYMKNHGRIMEHGKNTYQLDIVANLSIIKLDVWNGQHVVLGMIDTDIELKEEALRNKAIMEGLINEDVKPNNEDDEEYVAVKEDEYEDLTSTSEDAYRAYQEIFRMMDEGWMVARAE
nr:hypothetical protein [Tanacetum cinerariifolium]